MRAGITLEEFRGLDMEELLAVYEEVHEQDRFELCRDANLLCLLANLHRGKRRPYRPADFMPAD